MGGGGCSLERGLITTAFDMLIIARAPNLAAGKRGAGGEERGWWLVAGGKSVAHFGAPEKKGCRDYCRGPPRSSCTVKQFVAPGQWSMTLSKVVLRCKGLMSVAQITGEVKQITQK